MAHIMVDLETLGQSPGCAILSIGAVTFDPHRQTLGEEFYCVVSRADCRANDLAEHQSTLDWWGKQSAEARKVLADAENESALTLRDGLASFSTYVRSFGGSEVRIWGNGADFDNAILAVCFDRIKQPLPWKFWNNRCFRTLKSLNPAVPIPRGGTYHNALDDAKTQASAAIAMLQAHKELMK
jgi:hypothetical protein